MPQKELISLMEENIYSMAMLRDRLKMEKPVEYSRQQLMMLMRLHIGGRARLKDIARREFTTASNLCATFRKLEHDGLVRNAIDENDRRNTWYSVTPAGKKLAERILNEFRTGIATLFKDISARDEEKLTGAMRTVNELLKKMRQDNL